MKKWESDPQKTRNLVNAFSVRTSSCSALFRRTPIHSNGYSSNQILHESDQTPIHLTILPRHTLPVNKVFVCHEKPSKRMCYPLGYISMQVLEKDIMFYSYRPNFNDFNCPMWHGSKKPSQNKTWHMVAHVLHKITKMPI